MLRLAGALAVRPSLRCEAACAAAESATHRRIVHVSVASAQAYRPFTLCRVAVAVPPPDAPAAGAAPALRLRRLGGAAGGDEEGVLPPGAACALVLSLESGDGGAAAAGDGDAAAAPPAEAAAAGAAGAGGGADALRVELCGGAAAAAAQRAPEAVVAAFLARACGAAPAAAAPLLVALEWCAPAAPGAAAATGLHVLRPPPPPPPPSPPPAALRACLRGDAAAVHDFAAAGGAPAELTLWLEIRNEGAHEAREARVELLPPDEGAAGCWQAAPDADAPWREREPGGGGGSGATAARGLRPGGRYAWSGVTRRELPPLPPGATARLPVTLLLAAPGAADVRRWRVSWRLAGEPPGAPRHAQATNPAFIVTAGAP